MRIVCISDTHGQHRNLVMPEGDVVIHSGDFSLDDRTFPDDFFQWLSELPHRYKVVVAGNHDGWFAMHPNDALSRIPASVTYLQDSGCEIEGVKFWGSPWQPEFLDWHFNLPRGPSLAEKWAMIPDDTDVLVTHGPPHGILDVCPDIRNRHERIHVGCEDLRDRVGIVKPKLHVFGHIHSSHGAKRVGATMFVNASSLDDRYQVEHEPYAYFLR